MTTAMPREGTTARDRTDPADARIAPDPFALVLPALGALGAIASIAAINWVGQEKTADRSRPRRKPGQSLRDLETCCIGLREVFKRLAQNPRLFAGEGGSAASPLKFGVHGPRVDQAQVRLYHQLMSETASMMVLASQSAFDVMCAVEDGEIDAPETLFIGFGEQQEKLNRLLAQRGTLKACVGAGVEIADALSKHVGELKGHRVD